MSQADQSNAFALSSHGGVNPCDNAAAKAAKSSGAPLDVLMAIARVETGRTIGGVFSPWPWAVNQAGTGSFFDTAQDAVVHVSQAMTNGERNIDIGCFQINVRWHGDAFASLDAMFDPNQNASYAAHFLLRLYDEFGTWDGAIGAYHSRQAGAATAYLSKVSGLMAGPPPQPIALSTAQRDNRYPLLRSGPSAGNGSLVATRSDLPAIPLFR
ncbi:MAG: transglycosylase SLT domain-containing protein [Pseudotabrizicola sp.]|nr:transglycosylase SLT domain-containing protein [Pseudotabrizicola sp.]